MFTAEITAVQLDSFCEPVYDEKGVDTNRRLSILHVNIRAIYFDATEKPTTVELGKCVSREQAEALTQMVMSEENVLLYYDECSKEWFVQSNDQMV